MAEWASIVILGAELDSLLGGGGAAADDPSGSGETGQDASSNSGGASGGGSSAGASGGSAAAAAGSDEGGDDASAAASDGDAGDNASAAADDDDGGSGLDTQADGEDSEVEGADGEASGDERAYNTGGEYIGLEAEEVEGPDEAEASDAEAEAVIREDFDDGGDYESDSSEWEEIKAEAVEAINDFNTDRWIGDPPTVGLFTVFISFAPGMAFLECDGLGMDNEVQAIREGGVNHYEHQRAGNTVHNDIRLSRGYLLDPSALAIQLWRYKINSSSTPLPMSGLIILHDDSMQPIGAWFFKNGMLKSWSGPKMVAGANTIAIEELVIAHEGLTIIDTPLQAASVGPDLISRINLEAPDIPMDVMASIVI